MFPLRYSKAHPNVVRTSSWLVRKSYSTSGPTIWMLSKDPPPSWRGKKGSGSARLLSICLYEVQPANRRAKFKCHCGQTQLMIAFSIAIIRGTDWNSRSGLDVPGVSVRQKMSLLSTTCLSLRDNARLNRGRWMNHFDGPYPTKWRAWKMIRQETRSPWESQWFLSDPEEETKWREH